MKKWKLIAIISSVVIVVGLAITLIIIFTHHNPKPADESSYKYPSVEPSLTDPDGTFMKLGGRNLTNQEVYNTGILSYGLNVLNDLIDEQLLSDISVSDEELLNHKKSIYATYNGIAEDEVDFENEEQQTTFRKQMIRQGYLTDETVEKAIVLDTKRTLYAKAEFNKLIASYVPTEERPLYYTEAQIKQAISALYPDTLKAVILTFRSEAEANKLLKAVGVDSEKANSGWCDLEGNRLSKDEIIQKFIQMQNILNGTAVDEASTYKQSEVSSISNTISNYLFNTATPIKTVSAEKLTDAYTTKPKKYVTGYYYLALSIEKNTLLTPASYLEGLKQEPLPENIEAVSKKLFDNAFVATIINAFLYELRGMWEIEIYDERLDYSYYKTAQSLVGTLASAKHAYQMTTSESSDYVAKLYKDGKTIAITADQLYHELSERYGVLIAIQYMNFYLFYRAPYSAVYNYETKTKGANFDAEYQSSVYYLKEQLEAGDFKDQGFDANYGWEHFLRDYFGATDLDEALLVGDAYSEAINRFDESYLVTETPTSRAIYDKMIDAYINRSISIDEYESYVASLDEADYANTILYQIVKNFTTYYYVNATSLTAFYDQNGDTKADEITSEQEDEASVILEAFYYLARVNPKNSSNIHGTTASMTFAKEFLNALNSSTYAPITKIDGSTIDARLESLISLYNKASVNDSVLGPYKVKGLRFKLETNAACVDNGSNNEIDKAYRSAWQQILMGGLGLDNGNLAKFNYAEQVNSAVTALSATGFDNDQYTIPSVIKMNNQIIKTYLTGAVNATWYRYTEGLQDYAPDTERLAVLVTYYELSLKQELTDEEEKTYHKYSPATFEKNYLTNTVVACYNYLLSDDLMQKVVYDLYQKYLGDETFKFSREYMKDECLQFMEVVYTK